MRDDHGLEELLILQQDVKNWNDLAPYEKEYVLYRVHQIVMEHRNILGPDLTERALYAMLTLWNSLCGASRMSSPLD